MRKSTVASDGVHEWDVDLYCLCDKVFDLTQHGQVVLGLDVLRVGCIQARNETAERGDADTLANAKNSYKKGDLASTPSRKSRDIQVSMCVAPASKAQ